MNKLKEATFFVTNKCNFKCKHCFNPKDTTKPEMTLEQIQAITKSLPNFTRLQLSGGEPFMRKDLREICEAFYINNHIKYLTIPTNGYFTDKIINDVKDLIV